VVVEFFEVLLVDVIDTCWVVEVLKFLLGKERESLEETSGFWV
jgi:hypothetical protein